MKRTFTETTWRDDPWFRTLAKAFASCKTEREAAALLRDVGTLSELMAWSERFEVARRIARGETYRAITKFTGASTTTVTRVGGFLRDGEGGYVRVLKRHHTSAPRMSPKGHHEEHRKREEMPASNV